MDAREAYQRAFMAGTVREDWERMWKCLYDPPETPPGPIVDRLRICAECGMCPVENCPARVLP